MACEVARGLVEQMKSGRPIRSGVYPITETIKLENPIGWHVRGQGNPSHASDAAGVVIEWRGQPFDDHGIPSRMLELRNPRDCTFERLRFKAANPCGYAVLSYAVSGLREPLPTANDYRRIYADGGNGRLWRGIEHGAPKWAGATETNNSESHFDRVSVVNYGYGGHAGDFYSLGGPAAAFAFTMGQTKANTLIASGGTAARNLVGRGPLPGSAGVYSRGGLVQWGGAYNACENAVHVFGANDPCRFEGLNCEACLRLLFVSYSDPSIQPITFESCRWAANAVPESGSAFIQATGGGPLAFDRLMVDVPRNLWVELKYNRHPSLIRLPVFSMADSVIGTSVPNRRDFLRFTGNLAPRLHWRRNARQWVSPDHPAGFEQERF